MLDRMYYRGIRRTAHDVGYVLRTSGSAAILQTTILAKLVNGPDSRRTRSSQCGPNLLDDQGKPMGR